MANSIGIDAGSLTKLPSLQEYIWNEVFFGKNKDKWHAMLARVTEQFMREQV